MRVLNWVLTDTGFHADAVFAGRFYVTRMTDGAGKLRWRLTHAGADVLVGTLAECKRGAEATRERMAIQALRAHADASRG